MPLAAGMEVPEALINALVIKHLEQKDQKSALKALRKDFKKSIESAVGPLPSLTEIVDHFNKTSAPKKRLSFGQPTNTSTPGWNFVLEFIFYQKTFPFLHKLINTYIIQ